MTDIYKMKLHDVAIHGNTKILRVPGGWIYSESVLLAKLADDPREASRITDVHVSSVFVPMNSEFNRRTPA